MSIGNQMTDDRGQKADFFRHRPRSRSRKSEFFEDEDESEPDDEERT